MIFYRLGLQKIIEYFNQLFKEDEKRFLLLHKKPKKVRKHRLQTSKTIDLCVSTLLSLISALVCLSIPYAALETPCEVLKTNGMTTLYEMAKFCEKYVKMIDRLIVALSIIVICIGVKCVIDTVNSKSNKLSPWLERGKYTQPMRVSRKKNIK